MSKNLSVAIVGSGPSALYTAAELAKQDTPPVSISMIEKLPCIGGLARFGVAPDHVERRQVIEVYERLARSGGHFEFYGNVAVGHDIKHRELMQHHHAVIYATGAFSSKPFDVAGAELPGCWASNAMVGWYNGHPDYADLDVTLDCERAVVVGNGNVALDIARILLKTDEELAPSDMPPAVREQLSHSRIREVLILGRRGPAQTSFTHPELHELGTLPNVSVVINPEDLSRSEWPTGNYSAFQKRTCFERYATNSSNERTKQLKFEFLASPTEVHGESHVTGLSIVRNRLETDKNGIVHATAMDGNTRVDAGLIVHALGYRAIPLPDLPFDEARGVIPNERGRIIDAKTHATASGTYVTGWIKRGARGVIGTNKICAAETIASLLEDFGSNRLAQPVAENSRFKAWIRRQCPATVTYRGWKAIDRYEKAQALGRSPRRKILRLEQMLEVAGVEH